MLPVMDAVRQLVTNFLDLVQCWKEQKRTVTTRKAKMTIGVVSVMFPYRHRTKTNETVEVPAPVVLNSAVQEK